MVFIAWSLLRYILDTLDDWELAIKDLAWILQGQRRS